MEQRIRPAGNSDYPQLGAMLNLEGLKPAEMRIFEHENFVLENGEIIGFFTMRQQHGLPYLMHFIVDQDKRDYVNAHMLIQGFAREVKARGVNLALINTPENDERLSRLVEKFFGAQPYATKDGHNYFLVEVN